MRRTLGLLVLLAGVFLPALASADTVYLKNGRVLRAAKVTVTDDKVILEQAGNRIELPRSLVERVEKDPLESTVLEPRARRPMPTEGEGAEPAEPEGEAEGDAGEEAEGDEGGQGQEPAAVDKTQRAYWREQMQSLADEREELREQITALQRQERAFLFSHRSTAEVRRQIEQAQAELTGLDEREQQLRREARRLQIPPGWLRV